jgi:hypothetical protein
MSRVENISIDNGNATVSGSDVAGIGSGVAVYSEQL